MARAITSICSAAVTIGLGYLMVAMIVGADTLVPHKYIVITSDGKKYATNQKP